MIKIIDIDKRSRTIAIKNSELHHAESNGVLPISTTILLVNVAVGMNSDVARSGVLPMIIWTAIVSPTALASARITEVNIPGSAAGKMTFQIVCHLVAPSARLASSSGCGTLRIASSEMLMTVGRIITPRIKPAAKSPNPVLTLNVSRIAGTTINRPI